MYSRNYTTPNNVPPNYNGTSITPQVDEKQNNVTEESEKPYARVPLMDMPVYSSYSSKKALVEDMTEQLDTESANEENIQSVMANMNMPSKKIAADDILLIGLLIILLSSENADIKLIIAIGALLFIGL